MPRYDNIEFRWVNSEEEVLLAGQVLLRVGERGPERVLDIKGAVRRLSSAKRPVSGL